MTRRRDRFVNNKLLVAIARPQYRTSCSLNTLTAVINYLYHPGRRPTTVEAVCEVLRVDCYEPISPGNDKVMQWFSDYRHAMRLPPGSVRVERLTSAARQSRPQSLDQPFAELKRRVRSATDVLVYHSREDCHYNLVCGNFEAAVEPSEAFADDPLLRRWVVLGDHLSANRPIWCRRLRDIVADFREDEESCFLHFSRTRG